METRDADVIKCLLNPVRYDLFIGLQLRQEPQRVSDLAALVEKPVNSVSYHLSELERRGLVRKVAPEPGRDSRETRYVARDEGLFVHLDRDDDEAAPLVAAVSQLLQGEAALVARYRKRAMARAGDHADRINVGQYFLYLTDEQEKQLHDDLEDIFERARQASDANRDAASESGEYSRSFLRLEFFPLLDEEGKDAKG
ncbi:helix-turn-helix domain-containing protein [Bowdeniella massiliensis]|uniref:helix-turn-helix domain-containing protein n=1 Tax=Bowdeniella massiliensis TaxID=2932264 RepID=UPI0020294742|nr:helix-turn-helix domain-containing protein [Bowdeniella massiliensis]